MKAATKKLLKELEKTCSQFWNISRATGLFLNLLIKDRKYKTILEIGTSNGYSGIWLAEALSHTEGHLYTMESNKKIRYPLALENFKKSGLNKHISAILGHAPEDIPLTPKKFDLIFLDATKYEHESYFHTLKNRLKKGGIIITDNYLSHKKELTPYLKLLQKSPGFQTTILGLGTGLILSIKTS